MDSWLHIHIPFCEEMKSLEELYHQDPVGFLEHRYDNVWSLLQEKKSSNLAKQVYSELGNQYVDGLEIKNRFPFLVNLRRSSEVAAFHCLRHFLSKKKLFEALDYCVYAKDLNMDLEKLLSPDMSWTKSFFPKTSLIQFEVYYILNPENFAKNIHESYGVPFFLSGLVKSYPEIIEGFIACAKSPWERKYYTSLGDTKQKL